MHGAFHYSLHLLPPSWTIYPMHSIYWDHDLVKSHAGLLVSVPLHEFNFMLSFDTKRNDTIRWFGVHLLHLTFDFRWHGNVCVFLWPNWTATLCKYMLFCINSTVTDVWPLEVRWCKIINRTVKIVLNLHSFCSFPKYKLNILFYFIFDFRKINLALHWDVFVWN